MNNIDLNKPTISFGIAFKKYRTENRTISHKMLDIHEELKMYKRIDRKLKREDFVRTELGIKSKTMTLEKDNYVPASPALRYKDRTGEYFFDDNKINLHGIADKFKSIRASFQEIMNNISTKS